MPTINAELKQSRIVDLQIRADVKTGGLALKATLSAQFRKPIEQDDNTGLLMLQVIVSSEEKEEFYVSATEELIFEFSQAPDSFDQEVKEACIPVAVNDISDRLDRVLETMGHPPIQVSNGFHL